MSREVKVGGLRLGGDCQVRVQTMCNTHTNDVEASLAQCRRLAAAGAELIRLTVPSMADVECLREIHTSLRAEGITTPLVADVHFSSDIAIACASFVEKVRINPGNFNPDFSVACQKLSELIKVCKEHGTVLRIGLNHGSLGSRITNHYGNTPEAMKEAAMEWLRLCRDNNFDSIVVSLKASNTVVMLEAYRLLAGAMAAEGMEYPLHLGVTEAGNGDSARIKSAVAIATLLKAGIGDTIRVSLTEDPENEIPVGEYIADRCAGRDSAAKVSDHDRYILDAAIEYGPKLFNGEIDTLELEDKYLEDEILQACRKRFYKPEYIACPGCGRTMYNLEETFNEVKRRTAHLKGVVIAVMGCVVNGPGEMADADWGYVGEGNGKVSIYHRHEAVARHIPSDSAIDLLLELISKSN